MKAALLAIALVLGLAAPVGTDSAAPRPDGVLVLAALAPERVVVADPRSGRTSERELRGGTLCHGPLVVAGDRVIYFGGDGPLEARAARLGGIRVDESIGEAEIAVPSATPGRLWLGSRRAGRAELREVDTRGDVQAEISTPIGRWDAIQAQVGGEFLRTDDADLVLGDERVEDAWLVAAHPDRFAWCGDPCPRIGIWHDGARSALVPPPGIGPQYAGAFSPDGTKLALPVTVAGELRFAVVDVARNEWTLVPESRPGIYAALAWSPSGRWLYLADKRDRLLASRDGTGVPRKLPIRTDGTIMSIATS